MVRGSMIAGAALVALAACQPQAKPAPETAKVAPPAAPAVAPTPEVGPAAAAPLEEAAKSTITIDLTAGKPAAVTQKLQSPLQIDGVAPAKWFFEAQFPVTLAVDGEVITEAPARSQDDWTNGKPTHPYRARLIFMVTKETQATLSFSEDMPGDDGKGNDLPPKTIKVPVTLMPAG